MNRKRSPEFLAIPMVAAAVVYGGLLYWAVTDDTGLAWTIFTLANVAIVGLVLVLLLRKALGATCGTAGSRGRRPCPRNCAAL